MAKKIALIFLAIMFFSAFVLGSSIDNYTITPSVPLGQYATATGLYMDSNLLSAGRLCSFYFIDLNGVLIDRADDQYTDSRGYFAMRFPIIEPYFKRNQDYNIKAVCGDANASHATFKVAQLESIASASTQNFEFITKPENIDTLLIWGTAFFFFLFIAGLAWCLWKVRK